MYTFQNSWYRVEAQVLIGSGNGLVLSGDKPLPEPMLGQFNITAWWLGHNELIQCTTRKASHNKLLWWWHYDMEMFSILWRGTFVKWVHQRPVDPAHEGDSNADIWCFHCYQPGQFVEQTVELHVIWDAMTLMWHHHSDWKWVTLSPGPWFNIKM